MLQVTKIFRFEMAHAIYGYPGKCRNIHGHSYELHVTVGLPVAAEEILPAPGFIIDFKELKRLVQSLVVEELDHRLVLSEMYLNAHEHIAITENVTVWAYEPSAENILLFTRSRLQDNLPPGVDLLRLKLFETADSYAEWIKTNSTNNLKNYVFQDD
jgi:6-pyruvoyltetrahydropterin/6-carboxytetrahydropterin synthase